MVEELEASDPLGIKVPGVLLPEQPPREFPSILDEMGL
jgi:hypothetical protein